MFLQPFQEFFHVNECSLSNKTARSWRVRSFHFSGSLPLLSSAQAGIMIHWLFKKKKNCLIFTEHTDAGRTLHTKNLNLKSNETLDKTATPSRREVLQSGRSTQTPSWHFYPPQNFSCAPYIKHKENHSFVLHFFHGAKDDKQNEVSSKKLLKGPKREKEVLKYIFKKQHINVLSET